MPPTSAAMPAGPSFAALLERGPAMRWFAILLLMSVCACDKKADAPARQQTKVAAGNGAATPMVAAQPAAMEKMIPVPKDKAQLNRMLAMGYTVHEDHMHPPGVKECAFDKAGGSVIQ